MAGWGSHRSRQGGTTVERLDHDGGPGSCLQSGPLAIRLIERLAPASHTIREICQRLQLEPEIYAPVYIYDESPDLKFPPEVVRWAAEVGASVAADCFDLREDQDGPIDPTD